LAKQVFGGGEVNAGHVIGVDVGTGSARAGVFDLKGNMLASASQAIQMWKEGTDRFEQSGNDIWKAVCHAVKQALALSQVSSSSVIGIGFDATCSLVLVDKNGEGVAVGGSGDANRNVIVWMDQRASQEAHAINAQGHDVLKYVGGRISPEMQIPKLLWLKRHLPKQYDAVEHFFDLTDYLTWRATGDTTRSTCTVTCKWTFVGKQKAFDRSFFQDVGLGDISEQNFERIGTDIILPGSAIGAGLSLQAATDLGLPIGTAVAAGLIDAHAGAIGSIDPTQSELAYIFGTSACMLVNTPQSNFVLGVWGPYYNAMLEDQWLLEGGQSTAGAAIDQVLKMHPAYEEAKSKATQKSLSVVEWLEGQILARGLTSTALAVEVADLHIIPDFLGNRSPHADPNASAILCGVELSDQVASLQRLYVAAVLGVAYSAKQTIAALATNGVHLQSIVISGGASKSQLVRQLLADVTGLIVKRPDCAEPVLLGSAMIAAMATGKFEKLEVAMKAMRQGHSELMPQSTGELNVHDHKFRAYCKLQEADRRIGTFEAYRLSWAQKIDPFQQR
jgi:D-ribulokinase